jgi:hypothetical protein
MNRCRFHVLDVLQRHLTIFLAAVAIVTLVSARAADMPAKSTERRPPWQRMEFGPALFWTLQVDRGNIAYKGIAVRLDAGAGGVSKGRAWMIYDHDTLRVAAATTGSFVDWRGIAFDGSHQTHTSLTGERHFVNPVGPGWADAAGRWKDPRLRGRDGFALRPIAPPLGALLGTLFPRGESCFGDDRGRRTRAGIARLDRARDERCFHAHVQCRRGDASARAARGAGVRQCSTRGRGTLRKADGFWLAELPGRAKTRLFISRAEPAQLEAMARRDTSPLDLEPERRLSSRPVDERLATAAGKPPLRELTTTIKPGKGAGPFGADTLTLPEENPWQSWMRPGGFDFLPDGKSAVLCTWNGDVWRVDGLTANAPAPLRWRRLVAGLFQPLGVKVRGGEIFICCRDQIARLRDFNGDGEIDFIENFNNDHQVTEHFHEFAMGCRRTPLGIFIMRSRPGTHCPQWCLIMGLCCDVSADGARTDILATGFRAANGVCLNDDGTFFVTDQEGHWMPKNRINRVRRDGFYGNIFRLHRCDQHIRCGDGATHGLDHQREGPQPRGTALGSDQLLGFPRRRIAKFELRNGENLCRAARAGEWRVAGRGV